MIKVIGVRFRQAGKIYNFSPADFQVKVGDHVIVETARGIEYGSVVQGIREVADDKVIMPLKSVIRIATEEDDVMLITDTGTIIRLNVKDVSILGRSTQGVTLMRTSDGGKVVSIETLTPDMEDIEYKIGGISE